jgi:hypothetical protein
MSVCEPQPFPTYQLFRFVRESEDMSTEALASFASGIPIPGGKAASEMSPTAGAVAVPDAPSLPQRRKRTSEVAALSMPPQGKTAKTGSQPLHAGPAVTVKPPPGPAYPPRPPEAPLLKTVAKPTPVNRGSLHHITPITNRKGERFDRPIHRQCPMGTQASPSLARCLNLPIHHAPKASG